MRSRPYLFVGLAFACFAEAAVLHDRASYTATGGGTLGFGTMLYFSFVTIATLGYGDIVPVTSYARSLATMEAVLGQIYLVTIVARLVSLLGMGRLSPAPDDPGPAPANLRARSQPNLVQIPLL